MRQFLLSVCLVLCVLLPYESKAQQAQSQLVINVVNQAGWVDARYRHESTFILIMAEAGGWSDNRMLAQAWSRLDRDIPIVYVWARPSSGSTERSFVQNMIQKYGGRGGMPSCAVLGGEKSDGRVIIRTRSSGFEGCTLGIARYLQKHPQQPPR